jgi:hypothetical protein
MPVSSVIDSKERIMGGGVNSAGRKKGSRGIDWEADDPGIKEKDNLS